MTRLVHWESACIEEAAFWRYAREQIFTLPGVVGARDATRVLRNGIAVWVDGTEGVVTPAR